MAVHSHRSGKDVFVFHCARFEPDFMCRTVLQPIVLRRVADAHLVSASRHQVFRGRDQDFIAVFAVYISRLRG